MTRYEPTLILRRLVVLRETTSVYDELFHPGVNVVRGENSSGKSTVLNFIFYGLGGDLQDWSSVARLCSKVLVETAINGNVVTLAREISTSGQQPMELFAGGLTEALESPQHQWLKFGYRSSDGRESFSQALFRLMGVPEVSNDISGNITINQVLRLLYADQLSPIEDIFRFQRFDQASLRDTVGRLLCGAYQSRLYDNEERIKLLTREFDTLNAQLSSLFAVLGNAEVGLTVEWFDAQRAEIERASATVQAEIEQEERARLADPSQDRFSLSEQAAAYERVQNIQRDLGALRSQADTTAVTMADSDSFIASLENKLESMKDSSSVVDLIGEVHFHACPACYAPVEGEPTEGACHLCKTPFDSEQTRARIAALILDTGLQIKQSRQLQEIRKDRLDKLRAQISILEDEWQVAADKLATMQRTPTTEGSRKLRELHQRQGYLLREREDLDRRSRLADLIQELSAKKDVVNGEIGVLKSENQAMIAQQQKRLSEAYTAIAEEVKALLHSDLRRQDTFEDPEVVNFTFRENKISVDNESYFSASSRAILKSSFCLGFLAAATKKNFFRHPRFCMIDTLENMGVEPIRSHNFQLQIAKVSAESPVEHQIIYATAMIEPDLDDEQYTVGAFSTRDEPTIDIRT